MRGCVPLVNLPVTSGCPSGPEEWFVPSDLGVVMKEKEEGTIPCVVSNPQLTVSLYERHDRKAASGLTYEPGRGFTGPLNDTSYLCMASNGRQQVDSQVFYVFSVIGEEPQLSERIHVIEDRPGWRSPLTRLSLTLSPVPKVMEVDLSVSSRVLKQGEVLTVNCTVKDTEMVYFSWDFPRKEVPVSLSLSLSRHACSPDLR